MTNAAIIEQESMRLVEQGILRMVNVGGVDMPEPIHTFNGWKALGYSVKKGEKSFIKFPIWKHSTKLLDTDTGNAETDKMNSQINAQGGLSSMFTKISAFFTFDQVEPIKTKH